MTHKWYIGSMLCTWMHILGVDESNGHIHVFTERNYTINLDYQLSLIVTALYTSLVRHVLFAKDTLSSKIEA